MNVTEDRRYVVDRRVLGYLATLPYGREPSARQLAERCNITVLEAAAALERLWDRRDRETRP